MVLGEAETAERFRDLAGSVADKVGPLRRHRRMQNVAEPGELTP